ncbi:hypothetical protein [Marinomonas sp. 2405UD68-3]
MKENTQESCENDVLYTLTQDEKHLNALVLKYSIDHVEAAKNV